MKHLSRNEMKKVMGGNPSGCVVICYNEPLHQTYPISICDCASAQATCSWGGWTVLSCSCSGRPCDS